MPLPDSQHSNMVMLVMMEERVICGAKAKAILFTKHKSSECGLS